MAFRNVGLSLRRYTTAQLTALVGRFGPAGTQEVNAIQPGTIVFDTTTAEVKVFDGTAFVPVEAAA